MKALVKEMNLGFITADPPVVMSSQPKQQETSLLLHILFYKQNHINMQLNNCILMHLYLNLQYVIAKYTGNVTYYGKPNMTKVY